MSRWIITATEGIEEYMVEQVGPGQLVLWLQLEAAVDAALVTRRVVESVRSGLAEHGLAAASIETRIGPIERGAGKYKRFRRAFALPA